MTNPAQPLSHLQTELVRQILNDGNPRIGETLEMLLGLKAENAKIRTWMENLSEVTRKIPNEPMMAVKIAFEGDIEGTFIFAQPVSMSHGLTDALKEQLASHASLPGDAASYVRADWVLSGRPTTALDDEKLKDFLGELANVLFGNYLTAIYSRCALATFQESPEVRVPDRQGEILAHALEHFDGRAERCFLVQVDCTVGDHPIHFWLVMMSDPEGFRAMLDNIRKR